MALAHKMVVFATGVGKSIEGEVYFHGGEAAQNVKVTLVGPSEQVLGETTTDPEGKFCFPVRFCCDYRVIADAGAGHGAEYTVPAEELAADLPPPGETDGTAIPADADANTTPALAPEQGAIRPVGDGAAHAAETGDETPQPTSRPKPVAGSARERRGGEIEAVARQVAALRSDLEKYKNEIRLRDVLGGIGYILGIMGTAFYFLGVRRKEKRSVTGDS